MGSEGRARHYFRELLALYLSTGAGLPIPAAAPEQEGSALPLSAAEPSAG